MMSSKRNNVVKLFPRTGENPNPASRFETSFLGSSRVDGSPLTIQVTGQLAKDIRSDALRVGKDPKTYAVQGLASWYGMGGIAS